MNSPVPVAKGDRWYDLRTLLGCILLILAVENAYFDIRHIPNRVELGPRTAELRLKPVSLRAKDGSPFAVAGAWQVTSDDPRVGGISSLALDGGELVALTDSGAVIRFLRPIAASMTAHIREVPRGPATGRLRAYRDTEGLARDPAGRGWWVSYENFHHLWLYDPGFTRALQRLRLGDVFTTGNLGIEGIAAEGGDLLAFGEDGRTVVRVRQGRQSVERIVNPGGRISDVAKVGDGRMLAIERRPTMLGFRNALVPVTRVRGGYRLGPKVEIPAGPLDNFEGLAIDRATGKTRIWLVTDDNFQRPFRTVLLALDVDEAWLRGE